MTLFMALYLFLEFILSNQTLVSSSVVVVGEELGEQKVHIRCILPVWWSCSSVSRLSVARRICQLSEVLYINIIRGLLRVVLNTYTLFSNQVVHAMLALRAVSIGLTSLSCFQTIVAHTEHLASKSVGHDSLS